jgi:N-acetylmuramoyl-L-alanine amidase
MKILIDNGHGFDTPGKRSPDGKFREYRYTREIAATIVEELQMAGFDAERIVTEDTDITLKERCRRVNEWCRKLGAQNVLLVSIHNNAAGSDGKWHDARGWSVHVSLNASARSKELARCLVAACERQGIKVRRYSASEPWWPQNLAMCRDTLCPAVLTENLFQDNQADVTFLFSQAGRNAIVQAHVDGIIKYILMR